MPRSPTRRVAGFGRHRAIAAVLVLLLAASSAERTERLAHNIAEETAQVDHMVREEDDAFAAQAAAAGAVAQQRTDRALGRGDKAEGILPPMHEGLPIAPQAMGGFSLPASAMLKGDACESTCLQPCEDICSKHNNDDKACASLCQEMCHEGCSRRGEDGEDGKEEEEEEEEMEGDGEQAEEDAADDAAAEMEDCVPGCMSDCTPSCMKEGGSDKDAETCTSECNEFCDRDCSEADDMNAMLDDGLGEGDDDLPGLGDDDEGEDESLDSLMFGGDDAHELPGGPDCVKKCSADCADDCKLDQDTKAECMRDCQGECGELCKPLDEDLAGTDGDRLMDIAEKGMAGDDDDELEGEDADEENDAPDGLDGMLDRAMDDIDGGGDGDLDGKQLRTRVWKRPPSSTGSLGWIWVIMVVLLFLAFAALVTYMATRHKAFRFMRLPTNLNIV